MARAHVVAIACGAASLTVVWLSAQARSVEPAAVARVRGFSMAGSVAEVDHERQFTSLLSAAANEADFDVMTAQPHHIGSPYEIALADYVAREYAGFGLDVSRYEYSVLVPWPGERRIDIVSPDRVTLPVEEETLPGDRWAAMPGILPAYNAYSPAGDVTADVVYVNFGVPADYEVLERRGIDVKGKIVLARYGGAWRGIKPKVAAEHGAIGCLIYSDPHEDGYFQGDAYPAGRFRGAGMIQRGSVVDIPRYSGDPSTPGRPSKPGVERLPLDRIDILPKIPVQPMSYRAATEILKRLQGPSAPDSWRGALPITYHMGPGPAKVHLSLQMDFGQRRLINVVGRIAGAERPDEWVIVGGHRDAWVFGASDGVSGHVSVMAVARAMGQMLKTGWRPRRSVLFVSWDGEEPGLLGSTEWVEDLAEELNAKAAVYINRDSGSSGPFFSASGTHALAPFARELAQSIRSDDPSKTLYDRWLERSRELAPANGSQGQPPLAAPSLGALGSGSDYTPFMQHMGIASFDLALNGRGVDGTYHSTYDNPAWFRAFIDPTFAFSVLASQTTGIAALRFADAELLPFDYEAYGRQIREYIDEIEAETAKKSAADAKRLDFAALKSAATAFTRAGAAFRQRSESVLDAAPQSAMDSGRLRALVELDRRLIQAERDMVEPAGLPDRPWFRHTVYAPGLYTGYAVKTLPGVREAAEAGNYQRAADQARTFGRALERATATLTN